MITKSLSPVTANLLSGLAEVRLLQTLSVQCRRNQSWEVSYSGDTGDDFLDRKEGLDNE